MRTHSFPCATADACTHIVLGVLIGTFLHKQANTASMPIRCSANQRSASVLRIVCVASPNHHHQIGIRDACANITDKGLDFIVLDSIAGEEYSHEFIDFDNLACMNKIRTCLLCTYETQLSISDSEFRLLRHSMPKFKNINGTHKLFAVYVPLSNQTRAQYHH